MIYLDNAATTYPKPREVYRKWQTAMSVCGANPGRSGHEFSMRTAEAVFKSRELCAEFFGAAVENTVFTLNCTHALNFAVKGIARRGCHFVTSDMEHNAVIRPVYSAVKANCGSWSMFEVTEDAAQTVRNAERAIRPNTVALVCTAASNVIGLRTPIAELGELCKRRSICFILDAAQGAGALPITLKDGDTMSRSPRPKAQQDAAGNPKVLAQSAGGVNIICAAGHKGLYGPMGTGLLITDGKFPLSTIIEGGTGSASESVLQPDFNPDRFESGTINAAGVVALGEGVRFVKRRTPEAILNHELALCERFCEAASRIDGIILYNKITPQNRAHYAPVVAFNFENLPSEEGARLLSENGFYMRGGLHCAPLAHKKIGTINGDTMSRSPRPKAQQDAAPLSAGGGAIRFSPSVFNTARDIDLLVQALARSKNF